MDLGSSRPLFAVLFCDIKERTLGALLLILAHNSKPCSTRRRAKQKSACTLDVLFVVVLGEKGAPRFLGRLPLHFRLMAREIEPACTTLLKGHAVAKLFQTTLTFPLSAPFIMYGTYFALAPTAPFAFFVKVSIPLLPKGVPCFFETTGTTTFWHMFCQRKISLPLGSKCRQCTW